MSRIIAFAYADCHKTLSATYRGIAESMIQNAKAIMPGHPVVMCTDDNTVGIPGADAIFRVPRKHGLMTWSMACRCLVHELGDEVLFTEPDVRFREEIMHVFDDPDFDIAITEREIDAVWDINGQKMMLSDIAPFTLGTTFSRNRNVWKDVTKHCLTLGEREQNWIGDMISLAAVIATNQYKVKYLSGPIYNHIPCSREDACGSKVLHYKGLRKEWLFAGVTEA